MTPFERGAHRAVARRRRPPGVAKQAESLPEAFRDLFGREHAHSCGGQLECEGNGVDPLADVHDGGHALRRELEIGLRGAGPVDEQAHRVVRHRLVDRGLAGSCGARHAERRQRPGHLAGHAEGLTTRRQDLQVWARVQQRRREFRAGVDQVLAVVEDDQRPGSAQPAPERVDRRDARGCRDAGRRTDGGCDEAGVFDRRQVGPDDLMVHSELGVGSDTQRESRLPHAADPGDRDEAVLADELADSRQGSALTHERGARLRQRFGHPSHDIGRRFQRPILPFLCVIREPGARAHESAPARSSPPSRPWGARTRHRRDPRGHRRARSAGPARSESWWRASDDTELARCRRELTDWDGVYRRDSRTAVEANAAHRLVLRPVVQASRAFRTVALTAKAEARVPRDAR